MAKESLWEDERTEIKVLNTLLKVTKVTSKSTKIVTIVVRELGEWGKAAVVNKWDKF